MTSASVTVSVQDQSIYSEPNPQTVPLFVISTRANKVSSDGSGTAQGTTESDKLRVVTSQRELTLNYGNPVFVTSDGDPVDGDETNEYGLFAAWTFLGRGSQAYILRADIDLGELVPTDVEPTYAPPDGTYWIDKDEVVGGIFKRDSGVWVAVPFSCETESPETTDGVDGDWIFDYSDATGSIRYKNAGVWKPASDANLQADFGATANLHWGTTQPTSGVEDGDYWYKTTSSAGGTDLKLTRYRASDGVWVTQVVNRDVIMPDPNEGTIWEDLTELNSEGARPLFVGTGSQFDPLDVFVQDDAPVSDPEEGTYWYDDDTTDFALYNEGTEYGYGNQWVPITTTTVSNPTSREKVISASAPLNPNTGAIWVDLSTSENIDDYPVIQKWDGEEWTDITEEVLIQSDDPTASLVENGTYWMNTGESLTRNTVKTYNSDFEAVTVEFDGTDYEVVTEEGWHWEPTTGDTFGRKSQREIVFEKMQSSITINQEIRTEQNYFQLIACPGYPELYDEMNTLNTDNGEISFIVCDVPKFMIPSGIPEGREVTASEWITNANNVRSTGELGFASSSSVYTGFWYPWGISAATDGNDVFVPASHFVLRMIAFSDQQSAPWFPPAGYTRGRVDNASSVGYLNNDNDYTPLQLTKSQRDILYENNINPIAQIPNRGLVVWGQKTNAAAASALDRVNVVRLIAKMKYDLQRLLEPFLFEINDTITRRSAQVSTERYLAGLKSLRAMYDYAVRCDESNNPDDVIDRNELYVDVAIKPAKSIEFIYVPITILNTGDPFPF